MHLKTHHIPILAVFEIVPTSDFNPILSRDQIEDLADALATDLSRCLPEDMTSLLVCGGVIVEPAQLLQPGFGMWEALSQLAKPILRDKGLHSGVLAIGAHGNELPDDRLQPKHHLLAGQFICIPMMVITDEALGDRVEKHLETVLFESGSINPPARALLAEYSHVDSVHGQLLTRNDLMALQRLQLDAAGLSGFWDAAESALLRPDENHHISLPGHLIAEWSSTSQKLEIHFHTFDQWMAESSPIDNDQAMNYLLWLRAFRTLTALIESHGISWGVITKANALFDETRQCVIETTDPIPMNANAQQKLTQHQAPEVGLVAWTLIEDGSMIHLFPVSTRAIKQMTRDFSQRGLSAKITSSLCYNGKTGKLTSISGI